MEISTTSTIYTRFYRAGSDTVCNQGFSQCPILLVFYFIDGIHLWCIVGMEMSLFSYMQHNFSEGFVEFSFTEKNPFHPIRKVTGFSSLYSDSVRIMTVFSLKSPDSSSGSPLIFEALHRILHVMYTWMLTQMRDYEYVVCLGIVSLKDVHGLCALLILRTTFYVLSYFVL